MKALLCAMAFVSIAAFGQKSKTDVAPTTEDEYKYLIKGYLVQVDVGLDMKRGYLMQEMGNVKDGSYSYDFKSLIREEKNELAAVLIVIRSATLQSPYCLCIPQNNPDLMRRYFDDLNTLDSAMLHSYTRVLSAYFGQTLHKKFELEKKGKK